MSPSQQACGGVSVPSVVQLVHGIQPVDPSVIHAVTRLAQLEIDHPSAVTLVPLGQSEDLLT